MSLGWYAFPPLLSLSVPITQSNPRVSVWDMFQISDCLSTALLMFHCTRLCLSADRSVFSSMNCEETKLLVVSQSTEGPLRIAFDCTCLFITTTTNGRNDDYRCWPGTFIFFFFFAEPDTMTSFPPSSWAAKSNDWATTLICDMVANLFWVSFLCLLFERVD